MRILGTAIATALSAALLWPQIAAPVPQAPQSLRAPVTIRPKGATYKLGSDIRIELVTTNTSDQALPYEVGAPLESIEESVGVEVRDDRGERLPETKRGQIVRTRRDENTPTGQVIVTVRNYGLMKQLKPGESLVEELILNRLYVIDRPGKYTVQVGPPAWSGSSGPKSNTITVTVVK